MILMRIFIVEHVRGLSAKESLAVELNLIFWLSPRIFSRGRTYCYTISFVMLIFLLHWTKIFLRMQKSFMGASGFRGAPPAEESHCFSSQVIIWNYFSMKNLKLFVR